MRLAFITAASIIIALYVPLPTQAMEQNQDFSRNNFILQHAVYTPPILSEDLIETYFRECPDPKFSEIIRQACRESTLIKAYFATEYFYYVTILTPCMNESRPQKHSQLILTSMGLEWVTRQLKENDWYNPHPDKNYVQRIHPSEITDFALPDSIGICDCPIELVNKWATWMRLKEKCLEIDPQFYHSLKIDLVIPAKQNRPKVRKSIFDTDDEYHLPSLHDLRFHAQHSVLGPFLTPSERLAQASSKMSKSKFSIDRFDDDNIDFWDKPLRIHPVQIKSQKVSEKIALNPKTFGYNSQFPSL